MSLPFGSCQLLLRAADVSASDSEIPGCQLVLLIKRLPPAPDARLRLQPLRSHVCVNTTPGTAPGEHGGASPEVLAIYPLSRPIVVLEPRQRGHRVDSAIIAQPMAVCKAN